MEQQIAGINDYIDKKFKELNQPIMKRPGATNSLIPKQELISYTVPKKTILRVWFKKPITKPIRFFILCFKKLIFALVRKNR